MYSFQLFKSDKKNKKYEVIIFKDNEKIKTLNFGDSRYKDFIEYNKINPELAKERKRLYLIRHRKKEDFNNFLTPSYWSVKILWNYPTLEQSIKSINLN